MDEAAASGLRRASEVGRRGRPRRGDAAARSTVLGLRLGAVALNFASQIVLARVMRLSDFGVITTVLAIMNVASVPAAMGYDSTAIRFVALARESRPALRTLLRRFAPGILLANGTAALAMGALAATEALRGRASFSEAVAMLVLVVPAFALVRIGEGWLRGAGSLVAAQINSAILIPGVATVALVFAAALTAHHRVGAVSATAIRAAVTVAAALVVGLLIRRTVSRASSASEHVELPTHRELERIGLVICASGGLTMLLMQVDVIAVSYLRGTSDAGIYGAASRIALALNVAVVSANFILSPRISRLFHEGRRDALQGEVRNAAIWMSVSMTLGCGAVFAVAGFVLRLFGPQFGAAVVPLRILLVGQVVNGLTGPAGAVLNMTGYQANALRSLAAAVVIDIAALAILVPRFGINGAALATCGATVLVNVVMLLQVRRSLRVWALPIRISEWLSP